MIKKQLRIPPLRLRSGRDDTSGVQIVEDSEFSHRHHRPDTIFHLYGEKRTPSDYTKLREIRFDESCTET
jgi:hypothetical protein